MTETTASIAGLILDEVAPIIARAKAAWAARCHERGLSMTHFQVLALLDRGGPLTMSRLADQLGVSLPNATGIISRMEERERRLIEMDKRSPHAMQLAATAALEHFTAIMAHALLSDPRHLEGASPEAARLWRWHAMEEIEHKAVAFDTFVATVKGGPVGRYLLRCLVMLMATFTFNIEIGWNIADFFHQDRINRL